MDIEILTQNNMFHITRTNLDKIFLQKGFTLGKRVATMTQKMR